MNREYRIDSIPAIDFDNHPGFRHLRPDRDPDHAAAQRLVDEIDRQCEEILLTAEPGSESMTVAFRQRVLPLFDDLKSALLATQGFDNRFRDYALPAIDLAAGFLRDNLQARASSGRSSGELADAPAQSMLQAIERNGYCALEADGKLADHVWRSTWWERSILRSRATSSPGRHCALALNEYSGGSLLIKEALREKGVLRATSAYIGREMEFMYAALDYSHDKQSWYKDCYSDVGLPTARTAYLHFDADSDVMKAMLYLKDVSSEAGPFRYVRGSHRWARSAAQCAINRGFDAQQTRIFEMEDDGLDYKLAYYRPRYKLEDFRKGLMRLPKALRGSTHFGDDLVDGSALSDWLLTQEQVFAGPAGTFVVFDGSRGVHRGSQVGEGERWAVQIGMRAVRQPTRRPRMSTIRAIVGRLRYQLQRAKGLGRVLSR